MGKHFDALVEFSKRIRKEKPSLIGIPQEFQKNIPTYSNYLESIVNESTLFELSTDYNQIVGERTEEQHMRYINNYLDESAKRGSFLLTPFKLTAIENKEGVRILDNIKWNEYQITSCVLDDKDLSTPFIFINSGKVKIEKPKCASNSLDLKGKCMFFGLSKEKIKITHPIPGEEKELNSWVETNALAHLYSTVYIMDPENFIFRKESNQSKKFRKKKKYKERLHKTIMRPHYICLSERDTKGLLQDNEHCPAHPVRGHWRTLMSEKFVNKQGQRIFIKQYFTGEGTIQSAGGWTYQVLVKDNFGELTPYNKIDKE